MGPTLLIDLGKTSCVARYRGAEAIVPGAPGLASDQGVAAAARSITAAARRLEVTADAVSVGAAGAWGAPAAADRLAQVLVEELPVTRATVTSDVVTAHAGALGGGAGVVVIAGTGVAGLAVGTGGSVELIDGGGPVAGDVGSGGWIGAEAIRRAYEGASSMQHLLTAELGAHWQDGVDVTDPRSARVWGGLVPAIDRLAHEGDPDALDLLHASAHAVADTVLRAVDRVWAADPVTVCLVGGLLHLGDPWRRSLEASLDGSDRLVRRAPLGDALDGAALVATDGDHPYAARVHHATRGGP